MSPLFAGPAPDVDTADTLAAGIRAVVPGWSETEKSPGVRRFDDPAPSGNGRYILLQPLPCLLVVAPEADDNVAAGPAILVFTQHATSMHLAVPRNADNDACAAAVAAVASVLLPPPDGVRLRS